LRTFGVRMIEPNRPACIRACWPTMTFSTAVIVPKSRMFWNVRATPRAMILSGRPAVMSSPAKAMRPCVGLYSPVSMLKNVVFPAPLGPMIDTIDRGGIAKLTSLTAVRPPNCFVTPTVSRIGPPSPWRGRRP
jgi:hypothetical protein